MVAVQCQRGFPLNDKKPKAMSNGGTQSRKVKRQCKAFNTECIPASLVHVQLLK